MFAIATDRVNIIRDVNELCGENGDIRFQRANNLIAEDSAKGGFSVIVQGSSKDRKRRVKSGKEMKRLTPGADYAQNVIDDFLKRTKLNVLSKEHAAALLREGDIFLNVIVDFDAGLVLQVKRAPVLTMKRNADEYGEFPDIERAFSQLDPLTDMYSYMYPEPPKKSRMDFALYQINHIRWLADETKLYGRSQYSVARRCYKKIEEMEKALAYRRMYRSVSKRAHKLERMTEPKDVTEYKRVNAMIGEDGKPTKNAHLLSDFVGNVEIRSLNDEADLDQVKDIELMENQLWINLLVPKAIITGGQSINRDVLKVQYPHYLQSLNGITDCLEYGDSFMYSGYRAIIDLQLLLAGINPDAVQYDVVWSIKTFDELIDRIETVQSALGKGHGKQIITIEKAIQLVANDFDIENPREMYENLLEERGSTAGGSGKEQENEQKEQEKSNDSRPPPDNTALTDGAFEERGELDELTEGLTKDISSFFDAVYKGLDNSSVVSALTDAAEFDIDIVEGRFNLAWNKNLDRFIDAYVGRLVEAGVLGKRKAKELIKEAQGKYGSAGAVALVNVRIDRPSIRDDLLKASGARINGIYRTTLEEIRAVLSDDFDKNTGWRLIMKEIAPIIKDYNRAEMIARTEMSWAYNRGSVSCYDEAGTKHLIWDATKDLKRCEDCARLHGGVFSIYDLPDMPRHPRCRCAWLPYFEGMENKLASGANAVGGFSTDTRLLNRKDMGDTAWLKDLTTEEKAYYFGGKTKAALFDAGLLQKEDYFKPLKEIDTSGIIIPSAKAMRHSTVGDYLKPSKTFPSGRLSGGGHSQIAIEEMERCGIAYNVAKTLENGVRLGSVPGHKESNKRTGTKQAWFPDSWTEHDIKAAGIFVANKGALSDNGYAKQEIYNGVKVRVLINDGGISTICPSYDE